MKINKKLADGLLISTKDFDYAKAVRKPNAETDILQEFWFIKKGKNKEED